MLRTRYRNEKDVLRYNIIEVVDKMTIIVIGLGSMGKRRIRLMQAMHLPVDIVGVDSKVDRCNAVMAEFRVECDISIERIATRKRIDCAFVCTAPLSHAGIIKECLEHEWHVFTEINLVSDCYDTNIALAQEKGVVLFISSTPIYRGEMRKITEEVKGSGRPVSYLYHVGQYLPDWHPWEQYKDFFVGDNRTNGCREIFAIELPWMIRAFGDVQDVQVISSRLTRLDIGYQDTYLVQIMHTNGNQGIFAVDVVCRRPIRRLEVYNEELYIQWEGTPQTLKKENLFTHCLEPLDCGSYYNEMGYSEFVNEYAYMNEIREFFSVVEGKQPEYTMKMDANTLSLINQIEGADYE